MTNNIIRVGSVEIMSLSDGMLEFDLCNFFPTIPEDNWQGHESDLTEEHKVRFNLGSFLIRSQGRTILVDTGLGPKPADAPDVPWGQLMRDFQANGVRPDEVDMVVLTHLHRDHVGWNLMPQGERYVPTFPNARYWMSTKDWDACHQAEVQPQRFPNAPTCVWPLADLGLIELMDGELEHLDVLFGNCETVYCQDPRPAPNAFLPTFPDPRNTYFARPVQYVDAE